MSDEQTQTAAQATAHGSVVSVRGAMVDVIFAGGLPPLNDALHVLWSAGTPLTLEVQSHLDQNAVRTVAFQSTAGVWRCRR